jgi:hypothetical protein
MLLNLNIVRWRTAKTDPLPYIQSTNDSPIKSNELEMTSAGVVQNTADRITETNRNIQILLLWGAPQPDR